MTESQTQNSPTVDRVLEQSLPKPGVAEAMRFWHLTRPVPVVGDRDVSESDVAALDRPMTPTSC